MKAAADWEITHSAHTASGRDQWIYALSMCTYPFAQLQARITGHNSRERKK